jgi:hypothetical protein
MGVSQMTTPTTRPRRSRTQQRIFRVVNVPMRAILGLPFATPPSKRLMLVFLTGRKTGRSYRQPVSYVRDGTMLLTPGGGKWKFNLTDGKPVRIRLRGKDVLVRPEIVRDPAEVQRLLGIMTAANPMIGRFIPIPKDADGRFEPEPLHAALNYGFAIVRWHLGDD